jgi:UDPglucose 6-dehydrogenase
LYPGATKELQKDFPHLTIVFSPEFLSEKTAAYDAAHPFSNIIGMPSRSKRHEEAATQVQKILPKAPHTLICSSQEAELIKYIHNGNGYTQVVFFNMMYDLVRKLGGTWDVVEGAIRNNPFISDKYVKPVHKGGRGAGGNCFIKDFAALRMSYEDVIPRDTKGHAVFRSLEKKNGALLSESKKDQKIWQAVYTARPHKGAKKKKS